MTPQGHSTFGLFRKVARGELTPEQAAEAMVRHEAEERQINRKVLAELLVYVVLPIACAIALWRLA